MPGSSEIERGKSEAAHTVLKAAKVAPYLSPAADTPVPLRYAFYLLGDVRGKTVLDLGCGSGENIPALLARGANVVALDLSRELAELARQRVGMTISHPAPPILVASAYDVPLRDGSVDLILCASLLHHLNIPRAMDEVRRLVKPGGLVVVKEPVRFSKMAAALRSLFPAQEDVSEDEHPLTREELAQVKAGWAVTGERAFRLPLIPLCQWIFGRRTAYKLFAFDGWLLKNLGTLEHFSTMRVLRLEKVGP